MYDLSSFTNATIRQLASTSILSDQTLTNLKFYLVFNLSRFF